MLPHKKRQLFLLLPIIGNRNSFFLSFGYFLSHLQALYFLTISRNIMRPQTASDYLVTAKKNCGMCNLYKGFKSGERERANALDATKKAYEYYKAEFHELRTKSGSSQAIERNKNNRAACLDAIDECNGCDRENAKLKDTLGRVE
jgi:hypothetical protein